VKTLASLLLAIFLGSLAAGAAPFTPLGTPAPAGVEKPAPFEATLSNAEAGKPASAFKSDSPKIYLRWKGTNFKKGDRVKAVWIAEDIGEAAPKGYKIDEYSETVDAAASSGTYFFERPGEAFPKGQYRVDIYIGSELAQTLRFHVGE
jgi:hypothetical protein